MIDVPSGSTKIGNKAYRLDYDRKGVVVYQNRIRAPWLPRWDEIAFCSTPQEFEQHFSHQRIADLDDNDWLALAYFWQDIGVK